MAVSAPSALELADALRGGEGVASPFELWQAAERDSAGVEQARRDLFRHAMIHADYLLTARGERYRKCPICRGDLVR